MIKSFLPIPLCQFCLFVILDAGNLSVIGFTIFFSPLVLWSHTSSSGFIDSFTIKQRLQVFTQLEILK